MGNQASQVDGVALVSEEEMSDVASNTSFSREDLQEYHDMFKRKYENGHMTIEEFTQENMALQGGSEEFWRDIGTQFADGDDKITFVEFVVGMSSMTEGSIEDKLSWMFKLYDEDNNGVLDKQEVRHLYKGVIKGNEDLDGEKQDYTAAADQMFALMDADGNGSVDLDEFIAVAKNNPSIRDALTPALTKAIQVDGGRSQFSTFDNQVAGHSDGDAAMLKDPTGKMIFKPMAQVEYEFYEDVQKHVEDADMFPAFKGRKVVEDSTTGTAKYIVLEDLTYGMEKPCIMDLKMGFRGHDDAAGKKKVVQQVFLCTITTSSSLGFRLCGMKYITPTDEVVGHGKPWGAKLTRSTMPLALMEFVRTLPGNHLRVEVVKEFLARLRRIREWSVKQTHYKMYSSSILFIYDAARPDTDPKVTVKLVDFAHTEFIQDGSIDKNYLTSLEVLISLWESIERCGNEVWENQRRKLPAGTFTKAQLSKVDRNAFSSKDGIIPLNFLEPTQWAVDKERGDEEGWSYASSWKGPWKVKPYAGAFVRRRKWVHK